MLEQSPSAGCSPWGSVKEDSDLFHPPTHRWVGAVSRGLQATCRTACRQHAMLVEGQQPAPPLQSAGKPP